MRRKFALVAALATLGLGTACGSGGGGAPADDTFVYAFNLDIVTEWDPGVSYSNEIIAMQNIYETLTKYDPATKEVQPRLATAWEQSEDGLTWTFTLRDDVTFHTGRKLDATAAKQAIDRTIGLAGGPAYIWDAVKSIEAPDPATLVLHLKYAAPVDLIASSGTGAYIYDVEAAGPDDEDALEAWFDEGQDAGTGAYTVDTWEPGTERELLLARYDDYWGGWDGERYDAVEFRVTPEVTTAWQLLQSGEVDFVQRLSPELFEQAEKAAGVRTVQTPSFQNLIAFFNTADGPMADVRVRKAIAHAIDVDGLAAALQGAVSPADGLVPEGLVGAGTGYATPADLDRAAALLGEAGYGKDNPLRLTLTYAQGDDDQQMFVTLLKSALAQIDVDLRATPMQWSAQWDQAKTGKRQDIFVMYWYPDYADAYTWFGNLFRSSDEPYFNLSYVDDREVDEQIDGLAAQSAGDPAAAAEAYDALQQELLVDQVAAVPLFVQNFQRAYGSSVEGFVDNAAYSNVVFVHDLTVAE